MNSDRRGFYYYCMRALMYVVPFRKLRKKIFYASYLGSFANWLKLLKISKNYQQIVDDYKSYQKTRKAKIAVYACSTGNYDNPVKLKVFDRDCDYIMFVDNPQDYDQSQYIWELRPLKYHQSDLIRNARYHKIMVHEVLPEYEETIWIDTNIDLLSPLFWEDLQRIKAAGVRFAISAHPDRDCLYDEAQMCIEMGKDKRELIEAECNFMRNQGYPPHFGLFETNIMYRNMADPTLPAVMETWWQMVKDFSRRDQLSLMYAVWKNKATYPQPFNSQSYRKLRGDVLVAKHFKKRLKV